MAAPRLMIVFTLATAGVVMIVAALATESWWLLPVALLAHAAATTMVLVSIRGAAAQKGKPDPVTEARIEEERKGSRASDEERDQEEPRMGI